ncbi:MAG: hypothetical protein DI581_08315 [Staphylococcus capitis]|nr:MAG: hypothetical protein DI581_08315 [Staphylococcus capitis]
MLYRRVSNPSDLLNPPLASAGSGIETWESRGPTVSANNHAHQKGESKDLPYSGPFVAFQGPSAKFDI